MEGEQTSPSSREPPDYLLSFQGQEMSTKAGSETDDTSDVASTATSGSADCGHDVTHGRRSQAHRLGEGVGSAVTRREEEGGGASVEEQSVPTVGSSVTSTLAEFDVLRFKNDFLEVVEELRLRRVVHSENEERIKKLVAEKHELELKLEEERDRYSSVIEGHSQHEEEIRKHHAEQLKRLEGEKAKCALTAESKEREVKALKDEIRALNLAKYNLDKRLQEQERQIRLQASSRESYLTQMTQLEQKCSSAFKQTSHVLEQMERLESNAKGAMKLNRKLMYTNEHQKCLLEGYRSELEQCREELVEVRVMLEGREGDGESCVGCGERARLKSSEQELKMHMELNRQLQVQLASLREEHQTTIQQMKEAHSLIERHAESSARLSAGEVLLQEEIRGLKEKAAELEEQLAVSQDQYQSLEKRYDAVNLEWEQKCSDLEQRLRSLQSDYSALQEAHDKQEEERRRAVKELRDHMETSLSIKEKLEGELREAKEELETARREIKRREKELTEKLQNALEQSEAVPRNESESLQELSCLDEKHQREVCLPLAVRGSLSTSHELSQRQTSNKSCGVPDGDPPMEDQCKAEGQHCSSPLLSPDVFSETGPNEQSSGDDPRDGKVQRSSSDGACTTRRLTPRIHLQKVQLPTADLANAQGVCDGSMDEARDDNRSSFKDQFPTEVAPSALQSVGLPAKRKASDRTNLTSPPKRTKLGDVSLDVVRGLSVQTQGPEEEGVKEHQAQAKETADSADNDCDEVATVSQWKSRSLPSSQEGPRPHCIRRGTMYLSQPQWSDRKTSQDSVHVASPQGIKDNPTASHVNKSHSSAPRVPWKLNLPQPSPVKHASNSEATSNSVSTPFTHQQNDTLTCSGNTATPPDGTKYEAETSASPQILGSHGFPKEAVSDTHHTTPEPAAKYPPRAEGVSVLKHTETIRCSQDEEKTNSSQQNTASRPPDSPCKEVSPPPLLFSSEEEEEEEDGRDKMLSTQMNQQIDRVQVFLKMDRLKRPRHTKPIN